MLTRLTWIGALILTSSLGACAGSTESETPSLFDGSGDNIAVMVESCCSFTDDLGEMSRRPFPVIMDDGTLITKAPGELPQATLHTRLDRWVLNALTERLAATSVFDQPHATLENDTGVADGPIETIVVYVRGVEHRLSAYEASYPADDASPEVEAMADVISIIRSPPGVASPERVDVPLVQLYVSTVPTGYSPLDLGRWPLPLPYEDIPELPDEWRCAVQPPFAISLELVDRHAFNFDDRTYVFSVIPIIPGVEPCEPINGAAS